MPMATRSTHLSSDEDVVLCWYSWQRKLSRWRKDIWILSEPGRALKESFSQSNFSKAVEKDQTRGVVNRKTNSPKPNLGPEDKVIEDHTQRCWGPHAREQQSSKGRCWPKPRAVSSGAILAETPGYRRKFKEWELRMCVFIYELLSLWETETCF